MYEALFTEPAVWFGVPAVLGSAVFVLRLALMLIAGDGGGGGGFDAALDVDLDLEVGDGGDHLDPGQSFEILSVQAISAFLMGFGWAGLGGLNGAGWGMSPSIGAGLAGGIVMTWILAALLRTMYSLESSGNVSITTALNSEGEVYTSIPERHTGRGQVRVVLDGRQRIYNAVSEGEAIPTSSRVVVVRVNEDRTLTVSPV